jgi:hypothetical protein
MVKIIGTKVADNTANSDPEINWVPPDLLPAVWGMVLPGVEESLKYDPSGWTPDGTFAALESGRMHLHIAFRGDIYMGFSVSWLNRLPHANVWHVHILYSNDRLLEAFPLLEQAARDAGADEMTWGSPRKGFAKAAEKMGFKQSYIAYRKDIRDA